MSRINETTTMIIVLAPNMDAITGTYENISRLTPLLEVNVVAPVKFKARKAVTDVMAKRYESEAPSCTHQCVA
jgi:hypothetical protein